MAFLKRLKIELWSVGLALAVVALFAERKSENEPFDSSYLSESQIRLEAAHYLEGVPREARADRVRHRWVVSDGESTAWLDARSGELLEVRFGVTFAR